MQCQVSPARWPLGCSVKSQRCDASTWHLGQASLSRGRRQACRTSGNCRLRRCTRSVSSGVCDVVAGPASQLASLSGGRRPIPCGAALAIFHTHTDTSSATRPARRCARQSNGKLADGAIARLGTVGQLQSLLELLGQRRQACAWLPGSGEHLLQPPRKRAPAQSPTCRCGRGGWEPAQGPCSEYPPSSWCHGGTPQ